MSEKNGEITIPLATVAGILEAKLLSDVSISDLHVTHIGAADLLSDVLAFSVPGFLLLTGQISVQTIKTALVADAVAVVFVRGKNPAKEIVAFASKNEMPLFNTGKLLFDACGVLFEKKLKPC